MLTIDRARKLLEQSCRKLYNSSELKAIGSILLEELFSCTRTAMLLMDKNTLLSAEQEEQWIRWLHKLAEKIPLQYVLGYTFFRHHRILVAPGVLIPRPETEELVGWVLQEHHASEALNILDVGTGSGCIALALASELPHAQVFALEVSDKAAAVARENFLGCQKDISSRLNLITGDLFDVSSFACKMPVIDIVVSNPPYIKPGEAVAMTPGVLDYEPHGALFVPAEDPTVFYSGIASLYGRGICSRGVEIYVEINPLLWQETAEAMLRVLPAGTACTERRDLSGKVRMLKLTVPSHE